MSIMKHKLYIITYSCVCYVIILLLCHYILQLATYIDLSVIEYEIYNNVVCNKHVPALYSAGG